VNSKRGKQAKGRGLNGGPGLARRPGFIMKSVKEPDAREIRVGET
jgi:hypothetical protein